MYAIGSSLAIAGTSTGCAWAGGITHVARRLPELLLQVAGRMLSGGGQASHRQGCCTPLLLGGLAGLSGCQLPDRPGRCLPIPILWQAFPFMQLVEIHWEIPSSRAGYCDAKEKPARPIV
jgi:hypothetical protein